MMSDDAAIDTAGIGWPPPGLERARAILPLVRSRATLATMLLCPPLLWLLAGTPGLRVESAAATLLALILFTGLLTLLSALLGVSALLEHVRRSNRLGYPRRILLHVMADDGVHTRDLLLGTGVWREARDSTRDRVLRLRTWATISSTLAMLLPPPLLLLGMTLGLRAQMAPAGVLALGFLPTLLLLVTTGLLRGNAVLLQQWERAGGAWDPGPDTPQDLARAWSAGIGMRAEPQPASLAAVAGLGLFGLFVIGVFVVTGAAAATTVILGFGSRIVDEALGEMDNGSSQMLLVEMARAERLPLDSAITSLDAGTALHYALSAGAVRPGMQPIPAALDSTFHYEMPRNVDGSRLWWSIYHDSSSLAGAPLRLQHPAWPVILRSAAAVRANILGTRYIDAADARVPVEWESIEPIDLTRFVLAQSAASARAGRFDEAERDARALISLGLLLVDNSRTGADLSAGTVLVRSAYSTLANVRAAGGDRSLRRQIDDLNTASRRVTVGQRVYGSRTASSRSWMRSMMLEDGAYPALRWEALYRISLQHRCGSIPAMMRATHFAGTDLGRLAREKLVRTPADSAYFEKVVSAQHAEEPRGRWRGPERLLRAFAGQHGRVATCVRLMSTL